METKRQWGYILKVLKGKKRKKEKQTLVKHGFYIKQKYPSIMEKEKRKDREILME